MNVTSQMDFTTTETVNALPVIINVPPAVVTVNVSLALKTEENLLQIAHVLQDISTMDQLSVLNAVTAVQPVPKVNIIAQLAPI